jgi:hypothetical protein
VLSDYTALSKRRAAITRDIAQLRAEQTINYEERFLYIEPYTKLVDEHFHDIYKYTETVLTEALGKYDIVENKYPKNSQEKIEINRKALFYELRRFDTEIFAGEVFIIIRQISDIINQSEFKGRPKLLDSAYPGLRDTYELIKNKLKDQGISLEKQINHTKPDSFHGDALSSEYIKKMLGKDYNDTSRDIIEKYNGILCSYWRINGQLDSKAAALESELTTVRQQIKDLEAFISKSNMQKSAGQEYGKIIEDNKRQLAELQRQIKNVDNLTFCPDR